MVHDKLFIRPSVTLCAKKRRLWTKVQTQPAERVHITFLISRCNDVTGPNGLAHIQRGTSGDAKIQTAEKKMLLLNGRISQAIKGKTKRNGNKNKIKWTVDTGVESEKTKLIFQTRLIKWKVSSHFFFVKRKKRENNCEKTVWKNNCEKNSLDMSDWTAMKSEDVWFRFLTISSAK